jgi:4-hydroxyacetophenone monooxygenase
MKARDALKAADSRALLMAVVHITGDITPLARLRAALATGTPARLTDSEIAALRETAAAYLDRVATAGDELPPLPPNDALVDMMSVSAGEVIPPEYLPMLLDEAAFYDDRRSFRWRARPSTDVLSRFHVLVVGAGMSGICAGIRLRQAGIPFTVIEKNDDVGGTWLENRYPGCGVDTPNHLYSYSFARNAAWPRYFSKRDEILGYFRRCADEYGVREHIRFGTEVIRADYVAATGIWSVELRDAKGARSTTTANVVVSAVGLLNRPKMPVIHGMASFAGESFHSSRWPDGLDVTGNRVAVIGTGASAIQIAPTIADAATEVRVFQRSAPWVMPDPKYHRAVSPEEQWLFAHLPFYASWYRFRLLWMFGDRVHARLTNGTDEIRSRLLVHLMHELDGRDDLIKSTTPTMPPYGKRMLVDNNWFTFLRRDDARLVTAPIERIDRTGVITADGDHHDADVIVYATGFDATNVMASLELRGRSGRSLREQWGDDARAHLGMTVPDFPNLFCLYGPNTNLAYGGSAIFHTECQVTYVMECLRAMIEGGWRALECRAEAHDEYNERVDVANERMPWAGGDVGNWFKNSNGRVVTNSPWRMVDYWSWTREPDFADYLIERA